MSRYAVLYEPEGRAREFAQNMLGLNLRLTCGHGCKYPCYCPQFLHKKPEDFHAPGGPYRDDLLDKLRDDLLYLRRIGDRRRVHLSFIGDPFEVGADNAITQQAIEMLVEHGQPFQVLTKGGIKEVRGSLPLFRDGDGWLGQTILFTDDALRRQWEPNASSIHQRIMLAETAHALGIPTWVSLEPCIYPEQAQAVVDETAHCVDYYKVGGWNYNKVGSALIDWPAYWRGIHDMLQLSNRSYMVKEDMWPHLPSEGVAVVHETREWHERIAYHEVRATTLRKELRKDRGE